MSIALVGSIAHDKGANTFSTTGFDTTGASLLVAGIGRFAAVTPTLSDSKFNTLNALTEQSNLGDPACRLYYAENPAVGSSHTATATGSNIFSAFVFAAFSGAAIASVFDQQNGATALDTSLAPGSITPTEDNELVVTGFSVNFGGDNPTVGSGFSTPVGENAVAGVCDSFWMAYLVQTSASSVNPTWSHTDVNRHLAAVSASFKAAAGGGGSPSGVHSHFHYYKAAA